MSTSEPPTGLTRRRFLVTTAAAGVLAACGDGASDAATADAATPDAATPDAATTDAASPDAVTTDAAAPDAASPSVPADVASLDASDGAAPVDRFDPASVSRRDDRFPLGVQSGDPLPDGAVLWTRVADTAPPLELVVFVPDAPAAARESTAGAVALRALAPPAPGGFVHVDVRGLVPATAYHYTFIADGLVRSPVGRFATAPAPGARPRVVLGATSCARYAFRPFDVLSVAAADDLDAFVLLGDTVYADGSENLAAYRARWADNFGVAGYRDLLPAVACVATWDDHEVENNWDPETFDPTRLAAARAAFFEHLALRRAPDHPDRIWRRLTFGDTLDLFVLDGRSERLPTTRDTPGATYLSPAQLDWLRDGLSASTAVFKIIVNSVPITKMPPLFLGASGRWTGYAAQRAAVLDHTATVPGVIWLAGDFHFGAIARVDPPGGPHFAQPEILTGPVAHVGAAAVVELTGDPAQFPWVSEARNYARLTADPTTTPPTLTVEHVGVTGAVLNTATFTA